MISGRLAAAISRAAAPIAGGSGSGAGSGDNGGTGVTSDFMPNTFHGVSIATGRTRPLRS